MKSSGLHQPAKFRILVPPRTTVIRSPNRSGRFVASASLSVWLGILLVMAGRSSVLAADAVSAKISVRDFGAKGDGTSDDSPAFQKAFEQAVAVDHSVVLIPAGVYRLDRQVAVKFNGAVGNGLTIMGNGQGVSVIRGNNTDGAIKIRSELCKTQVTIRDLTFLAAIQDAGTAIEVSSSLRGVRNYRTLTVQNVDMRGSGLPTHNYFSRGLCATAQWRPIFQNVVFSGILDPALKESDPAHDDLRFKPEYGISADWSYAPSFQHCYAWSCHTGYRIVCRELAPEGPEDGVFYRCTAVGTRIGIDLDTPTIEPQVVIDSCHINCREVGIRIHNRKFFHIINCLLYGWSDDKVKYADIQVANCWAGLISGNIFQAPTRENLQKLPASKRTCISIDKQSKDLLLMANTFNAKGVAIAVENGAKDIKSTNNQYTNPHVTVSDRYR